MIRGLTKGMKGLLILLCCNKGTKVVRGRGDIVYRLKESGDCMHAMMSTVFCDKGER